MSEGGTTAAAAAKLYIYRCTIFHMNQYQYTASFQRLHANAGTKLKSQDDHAHHTKVDAKPSLTLLVRAPAVIMVSVLFMVL